LGIHEPENYFLLYVTNPNNKKAPMKMLKEKKGKGIVIANLLL